MRRLENSGPKICMVANNLRQGVGVTQVVYDLIEKQPAHFMLLYVGSWPIDGRFERLNDLTIVHERSWVAIYKSLFSFRREGGQIIHAHGKTDLVCIMGRLVGLKVLRTLHYGAHDASSKKKNGLRVKATWIRNILMGRIWWVNHWVGVSESSRRNITSRWNVPEHKTSVIYNGIDIDEFCIPSTKEKQLIRVRLKWDESWLVCLSAGSLTKRKRHDKTIKAFVKVSQQFPNARLMIAGDGREEVYLRSLIDENNLREKILLLGLRSDISDVMKASDVFIHNAVDEAFGLVVAEAMCAGLAPIVLSEGGPAEIVSDGKTGLLVRSDDPMELTNATSCLIADPRLRSQLSRAAHRHAVSNFPADITYAKYTKIYAKFGIETE